MHLQSETATRAALIDELGELQRALKLVEPQRKREETLKKEVASWYENEPADKDFIAEGKEYQVQISARRNQRRVVDMKALYRFFKLDRFLKLCSLRMEDIDREVPEQLRDRVVVEERKGSRSVVTVRKSIDVAAHRRAA